MKIVSKPAYFDGSYETYFRSTDVSPQIVAEGTAIEVYDGQTEYRSWGRSFCSSDVLINTRTFAMVLVGFKNKHSGGQGYYYFEKTDDGIKRRTAGQLSKRRRRQVMEAYEQNAPSWANRPVESIEKTKPSPPVRHIRFKQVARDEDGQLLSIYDGTEYEIGRTLREKSKPNHNGGFYVYRSIEDATDAAFPSNSRFTDLPRTILKCETWGNCNVYDNDKESWTYCKPLEVVHNV